MTAPLKTTVLGPTGRLGRAICEAIVDAPDFELVGAIVRPESSAAGQDVGELIGRAPVGCAATSGFEIAAGRSDVVIDASQPAMTVSAAERLAVMSHRCCLVTGVTGFRPEHLDRLNTAALRLPILMTGNFSLGIAVVEALVSSAAALPAAEWDIEIAETHHRRKIDAPSGTALLLGRAAARKRGVSLEGEAVWSREGACNPRQDGEIGFSVTRGGSIIGEHTVRFLAEMEEIAITHRAFDRRVFARGALAAARWMGHDGQGRAPGLYSMQDVVRP